MPGLLGIEELSRPEIEAILERARFFQPLQRVRGHSREGGKIGAEKTRTGCGRVILRRFTGVPIRCARANAG